MENKALSILLGMFIGFGFLILLSGCKNHPKFVPNSKLQIQIDSLKLKNDQGYKPGLGEFMIGIQLHHAKLWFAGINQNWALSEFEIKEIKETVEDIKINCADRPEVKLIPLIDPPIDSLISSIRKKNLSSFKKGFVLLTNTCNNCHKSTSVGFNVIKIPDAVPVTNQVF